MTPERETAVLRHIKTLGSVAEAHGFRDALRGQGETLTSAVYADLLRRIDELNRKEAKR